jgi:hypothetical protein
MNEEDRKAFDAEIARLRQLEEVTFGPRKKLGIRDDLTVASLKYVLAAHPPAGPAALHARSEPG